MSGIGDVTKRVLATGVSNGRDMTPCSRAEVNQVAEDQGVVLPDAYVRFLMVMGRGTGWLFRGSDFLYPAILGLKRDAEGLLDENNNPFELPPDLLVFYMHQGYQFAYMLTSNGDDPPVHFYCEGDAGPSRVSESFTEFLIQAIDHTAQTERRMRPMVV